MYSYNYHLDMFLHWNNRRVSKEWRNEHEELIVKQREEYHAGEAARYMPETLFAELVEIA